MFSEWRSKKKNKAIDTHRNGHIKRKSEWNSESNKVVKTFLMCVCVLAQEMKQVWRIRAFGTRNQLEIFVKKIAKPQMSECGTKICQVVCVCSQRQLKKKMVKLEMLQNLFRKEYTGSVCVNFENEIVKKVKPKNEANVTRQLQTHDSRRKDKIWPWMIAKQRMKWPSDKRKSLKCLRTLHTIIYVETIKKVKIY